MPESTPSTVKSTANTALFEVILNLSHFHREHEKFYASAPREIAVRLQRHGRTLQALADQWMQAVPAEHPAASPYAGAEDLNSPVALQLDGVLFMEGEGRPAEIDQLLRDLTNTADDFEATGQWLAHAMQASWNIAAALIDIAELADVLGERHRIIANDWQAASLQTLIATLLRRAVEIVETIDMTPHALRSDLASERVSARRLYAAAEIIGHAADLTSESAGYVLDNERRWRVFRQRVAEVLAAYE